MYFQFKNKNKYSFEFEFEFEDGKKEEKDTNQIIYKYTERIPNICYL